MALPTFGSAAVPMRGDSGGGPVQGAAAQTFPRYISQSSTLALISQQLYLASVNMQSGLTLSSISFLAAAALVAATHQIFGLFDDSAGSSSGVPYALLAQTSDDGANAWATNAVKTLNLTAQYKTTRAGLYYLGVLVVATTPPTLRSVVGDSVAGALPSVFCGQSTAAISALPNPAAAPAIGAANLAWAYCS